MSDTPVADSIKAAHKDSTYRTELTAVYVEFERMERELAAVKAERDALVMAVGNKYPNETRFETALRYIRQAENQEMLGNAKDAARGRE